MSHDKTLWAIVGSFVSWELYAHFINHNKTAHTLSDLIGRMEAKHPGTRKLVAAACGILFVHLVIDEYKDHKKK